MKSVTDLKRCLIKAMSSMPSAEYHVQSVKLHKKV